MFRRAWRLLAVAAVASSLGACIYSDYDIAKNFEPQFPIKPGTYVRINPEPFDSDKIVDIARSGDAYRVYSQTSKRTNYARLFKIPEYSDYVLQYYHRNKMPIVYLFLKPTEKGFDISYIEEPLTGLPEHLKAYVTPYISNGHPTPWPFIINGRRDTDYVVREYARANLKMKLGASYERRP